MSSTQPERPKPRPAPSLLVVDDHASIRSLVRTLATGLGYQVVGEATDGRAGVTAALRLDPDLIVMDWNMPELDGVAATREIRRCRPAIDIVAYSSAEAETVADAFRAAGASAYVSKTDIDGLVAELERRNPGGP
jgi:CheY-like chemotaxis protein